MKRIKRRTVLLHYIGMLVLLLAFASQVRSTEVATTNYYLDTPLPSLDYYCGVYANGSYFAINGSTWDNFIVGSNLGTIVNTCVNALPATGGAIGLSGDLTLTSSTGIDLNQSNTVLLGVGFGTRLSLSGTFNDHVIHVTADYVTVKDLWIDGTNQASTYHGILLDGNGNGGLFLDTVYVRDCGDAGVQAGDTDASWEGNWAKIHHLVSKNNGNWGLRLTYDATDSEIMDFLISDHTGAGDAGINIDADNVRLTTGHLWGNEYEMLIAETQSVSGLIVTNVGIMDGGGQGGHRVYHSSSYNFRDSVFTGCEFWVAKLASNNVSSGLVLTGDSWNLAVIGNVFRGDNDAGTIHGAKAIILDGSSAAVHNITIVGNSIRHFGYADPIDTANADGNITEVGNVVTDITMYP